MAYIIFLNNRKQTTTIESGDYIISKNDIHYKEVNIYRTHYFNYNITCIHTSFIIDIIKLYEIYKERDNHNNYVF